MRKENAPNKNNLVVINTKGNNDLVVIKFLKEEFKKANKKIEKIEKEVNVFIKTK